MDQFCRAENFLELLESRIRSYQNGGHSALGILLSHRRELNLVTIAVAIASRTGRPIMKTCWGPHLERGRLPLRAHGLQRVNPELPQTILTLASLCFEIGNISRGRSSRWDHDLLVVDLLLLQRRMTALTMPTLPTGRRAAKHVFTRSCGCCTGDHVPSGRLSASLPVFECLFASNNHCFIRADGDILISTIAYLGMF